MRWSPPEQKASGPSPVRMMTPVSWSSRASSRARCISLTVSGRKALRTSGRFMVILAIPPTFSYFMSSNSPAGFHVMSVMGWIIWFRPSGARAQLHGTARAGSPLPFAIPAHGLPDGHFEGCGVVAEGFVEGRVVEDEGLLELVEHLDHLAHGRVEETHSPEQDLRRPLHLGFAPGFFEDDLDEAAG